jgi:hypothetical protein
VDDYRCLSLIQHATKLYLLNHAALAYVTFTVLGIRPESDAHVRSEEMFYQLALMQFGSYRRLRLDPPPPLRTLLKLAVDAEPGTEKSGLSKNEVVDVGVPCADLNSRITILSASPKHSSRAVACWLNTLRSTSLQMAKSRLCLIS